VRPVNSPSPDAAPPSTLLRVVSWVEARPRAAALGVLLLCIGPLALTIQFFSDIRAGLTELLPKTAPAVKALEAIHERLGAKSRLIIIAESPDASANQRFITELNQRLQARHVPEAGLFQAGCFEECQWLRDRALLLAPQDKYERWMDQIEDAVRRTKLQATPLFVDLEGDPAETWREVDKEFAEEAQTNDRFPQGYFQVPDGTRVVMLIWLRGNEVEIEPSANLLRAAKEEVAAIRSKYPPEMVVGYSGEVANLVEEHDAILADLSLSSAIVFLLVGAVILLYFRSMRGLAAVLFALTPGLLFTFAIGRLTVHHLNSNTAFLGSIIAGNGINYPLVFLAYYRGRPPGEGRASAILAAGRQALFGTLAAALSASAAYGGLAVSSFKGFSQFGWIGGVGMVTTWLCSVVSMPVAISLLNPPREERPSPIQGVLLRFFSRPFWPGFIAAVFVFISLGGGIVGARRAIRNGLYEMDMRALRNRDSLRSGSASWDTRVNSLFGVWMNPVAGLVDDPAHREPLAMDLKRTLIDGSHVAERVETIQRLVPSREEQVQRIKRLEKLSKSLAHVPSEEIPERARPYLEKLRAGDLKPISIDDVPEALKLPFTETGGRADRVVLLFPSLQIDYNEGQNIIRFADELHATPMPPDATVGGSFLFMAEIIRLVRDEAPRVVLVVALLVALVLAPLLLRRPLRILLVVSTVGSVALLAQANMLMVGVKLNMLNFAAVPITIGVGADYVVNLLGAMDALKADARRACAKMGGAIFLCSLTTVIGYVSLLMAQSGALRTFGWAAVLGEVMAVTTVLVVLPVLLARRPAAEMAVSQAAA
jgi:uncharacterized protein